MAELEFLAGLNKDQLTIAQTLERPLFVEAGAGSGKTFTLTQRIAWALSPGSGACGKAYLDSLDQVLVITFTEAAAREIRERVRKTLRAAGAYDPHMREAALAVDGAWISTIHGMCSRILHQHALDLGIDPNFSQCTENQADELKGSALEEVVGGAYHRGEFSELFSFYGYGRIFDGGRASGVLDLVTSMIAAARRCLHGFDDLVLVGGEGAKTIYCSVIRLLTAFEELGSRKLTPKAAQTVQTSLELLHGLVLEGPTRSTRDEIEAVLTSVSVPRSSKTIADIQPDVVSALALARAELAFVQAGRFGSALLQLARQVDERYTSLKHEQSLLDNDDLIHMALQAVRKRPEVAADYAQRFRLVMVDEFQDTDETQLELIGMLAGKDAEHLCTVGDAQQSIYRFRGADVEVFFKHGAALPTDSHVRLQTNYRSHADILNLVERICGGVPTIDGTLAGGILGGYMHLDANPEREDTYAAQSLPRVAIEAVTGPGQSGRTTQFQAATLAAQIADRLAQYAAAGTSAGDMALLLGTSSHAANYIDALRARGLECVVTGGSSFNSTSEVQVMCALLYTLANPGDTQSGLFPLLSSEVFALDADDFCMLGTRPQEKLDAPTKRQIDRGLEDMKFFGSVQTSERLKVAHAVLSQALADLAHKSVADVCLQVVRDSGWLARLSHQGAQGMARAANVLAAVRYIRDLTEELGLGPARAAAEFNRWLNLAKIPPASFAGGEAGTIQVMTIHASKGLEFPVVAVAECWSNPRSDTNILAGSLNATDRSSNTSSQNVQACVICPKDCSSLVAKVQVDNSSSWKGSESATIVETYLALKQLEDERSKEEKARLLYVALTRAQEAVVLGISCASSKAGISSTLAAGTMRALVGSDMPAIGEQSLNYGGSADALLRVVEVCQQKVPKGDPVVLELSSAGSMAGFDAELIAPVPTDLLVLGTGAAETSMQDNGMPDSDFVLYQRETEIAAQLSMWRPRQGVFSFSSMKAVLEDEALQHNDNAPTKPRVPQLSEEDEAGEYADADRATNLGSAFHELAQTMIETGCVPSDEQLEHMSIYWHLSSRAELRLQTALQRWTHSDIRAEALQYKNLHAELPFFAPAPKGTERFGDYIEGAIDLLCTNPGSTETLLVDYKTGDKNLTPAEIYEHHKTQARLYASVLINQGFTAVTCAFVCVELDAGELLGDDKTDQPYVVRYDFHA